MIQSIFYYFPALILVAMLASCAGTEQRTVIQDGSFSAEAPLLFAAWQPVQSSRNPVAANRAVRELLRQADILMADNAMEQASDKLERLLRIEPAYAQAWSRLAWIALQINAPERSRQMALRSNSYAFDNSNLKALNWSFIREAGESMNDEVTVRQADVMIQRLGGGM